MNRMALSWFLTKKQVYDVCYTQASWMKQDVQKKTCGQDFQLYENWKLWESEGQSIHVLWKMPLSLTLMLRSWNQTKPVQSLEFNPFEGSMFQVHSMNKFYNLKNCTMGFVWENTTHPINLLRNSMGFHQTPAFLGDTKSLSLSDPARSAEVQAHTRDACQRSSQEQKPGYVGKCHGGMLVTFWLPVT